MKDKKSQSKVTITRARRIKKPHDLKPVFHILRVLHKKITTLSASVRSAPSPLDVGCTLDTKEEVEAVVIAALQIRYPEQLITTTTDLDTDLGMTPAARAVLLTPWMLEATKDGGCATRLGNSAYSAMATVQDIIDGIWGDLQNKCDL